MSKIVVRLAEKKDISEILEMVKEFSQGHPSEVICRDGKSIETAFFNDTAVGELIVAERDSKVVGMVQWYREYDMFWEIYKGVPEWLFVRKESRGLGISIAMIAFLCDRVRKSGGHYLSVQGGDMTTSIYKRYAVDAGLVATFRLTEEAFQQWADLAGASPREIIRRLPDPELNNVRVKQRPKDID